MELIGSNVHDAKWGSPLGPCGISVQLVRPPNFSSFQSLKLQLYIMSLQKRSAFVNGY